MTKCAGGEVDQRKYCIPEREGDIMRTPVEILTSMGARHSPLPSLEDWEVRQGRSTYMSMESEGVNSREPPFSL